ncbi:MAG: YjbH domain-containing protein [Ignavibacteria bacterium]|nr:YjbH domain-containing protein [Ignavibacteria bacterium]
MGKNSTLIFSVFIFLFLYLCKINCQSLKEPTKIVELQTAGVNSKGTFSVESWFFKSGGLRIELNFTPFSNFILGVSYGGTNLIGSSNATFQNLPGLLVKFRVVEEKINFPAFAVGISTQGFGPYYLQYHRFETLSPGIFFVGSKAFKNFLGICDLHLGLNYSLELKPKQRAINFYAGVGQKISNFLRFSFEYNSNLDEKSSELMRSKGLLNTSLYVYLSPNVQIGLIFKDLLTNIKSQNSPERNLELIYSGSF